jgi:hypothetical protein
MINSGLNCIVWFHARSYDEVVVRKDEKIINIKVEFTFIYFGIYSNYYIINKYYSN